MKVITIFINGVASSYRFQEGVEKNMVAWIDSAMKQPKKRWIFIGTGPQGDQKIVLKGKSIDGYSICNAPPEQESPTKILKEFLDSQKDEAEDWKDDEG